MSTTKKVRRHYPMNSGNLDDIVLQ